MKIEEIDFRCPLCGKKFSAKNVKGHVKRRHPEMDAAEFISLLRKTEEAGMRVVERKRIELQGVNASPRTAFSTGALAATKFLSVVPGGSVGLGKKR